jgi:hypothetical protein
VSNQSENEPLRKLQKLMFVANLFVWAYFWLAFAHSAVAYDPRPWGHIPVDPYVFGGHAIGLTKSSLTYPFMKLTFRIEFPSFLCVALFRKEFLSGVSGEPLFAGISAAGYELLVIMLLSFVQWFLLARVIQRRWCRWIGRPTAAPNQA